MNRRSFITQTSAGLALMAQPSHRLLGATPQETAPGFRFGAVYFRGQNNPPREDWDRDHRVAAEDGHTLFRHWVSWNVVEVAPGKFDWADYERMLDLAAQNVTNSPTPFHNSPIAALPKSSDPSSNTAASHSTSTTD